MRVERPLPWPVRGTSLLSSVEMMTPISGTCAETPAAAEHGLAAETIGSIAGLERLKPEWADLWARIPTATPFQSPAWLLPWWRHLGGGELLSVAVRRSGRLVGLAPMFVYVDAGVRKLLPIGIGISDHHDVLLDPAVEAAAATALFACLRRERGRWHICEFEELRPAARLLALRSPPGWSDVARENGHCPVLPLREGAAEIRDCIPRGKFDNVRLARSRARRRGAVALERATPATVGELLEALIHLHGALWASRGEAGVLTDPRVRNFHREAAPALLAAGVLRLYALRIGGQIVGVYYGFLHRGRAYAYLTGVDPAYSFESPGTVLFAHAIEEAMREGAGEFDWLRGREPYKYAWGAKDRPNVRRRFRLNDA
jgi:CelD/BcsL family acetyltransferase involved in cellulose biosynthesis